MGYLGHEQKMFAWRAPFETRSASNLARYQASVNREMTGAIKELERLQEIRKTRPNPSEPSDEGEPYEPAQPADAPQEPDVESCAEPSTSLAPAEGGVERAEAAHSGPPATRESCGTNPPAAETCGPVATEAREIHGDVPLEL